jgi:tryptophan-rich sensory protein
LPVLTLLPFIGLNFIAAMSGAMFPPGDWYDRLEKPSWQPPKWAFPAVWSVLYVMIAVSAWLVWTRAPAEALPLAMAAYGVQLVLNGCWSWIFFGMKRMRLALAELILLWLSVLAMIVIFWPLDTLAAVLLLPYLAWVTTAGYLNYTMIRLNPTAAEPVFAGR